jgi:ubiquinone/menaquinone biosynthesis C-methylase UbiE
MIMNTTYTAMSFRDIAQQYNSINFIPETAKKEIGHSILNLVGKGKKIIDVGAGAGRITIPIAETGLDTTAFDVEEEMLAELTRLSAERGLVIDSLKGDIARMPFDDETFDAVFTSNVLHLVDEWKLALADIKRILKPNGLLIQGRDWLDPTSFFAKMRTELRKTIAHLDPTMIPTAAAGPQLFQHITMLGGLNLPDVVGATWIEYTSPAQILERMQKRKHNETWQLEEKLFQEVMAHITDWTHKNFPDLTAEEPIEWKFLLYITRFNL